MDVNPLRAALLTALLLTSTTALAQATVADIDRVQADTLLARAKASLAKAQKDLAESQGNGPGATSFAAPGLPVARGIFGANGKRYVTFVYPGGGTAEASAGGRIPGDYTVRSFDATGVVLTKAGATHRIPFSMQAATPPSPTVPSGISQGFGAPMTGPVTPIPPLR
jgi:hypothetical protein